MAEELVYTTTTDDFLLEGVIVRPDGAPARPVCFVWLHGNAARFYDYPYVTVSRALARSGYPCLSGNTRGHDIAAFVWRGAGGRPSPWQTPRDLPTGGGAGWERLEDASTDVAAWVDVASQLAPDIVLVGHSSGAQRVVLFQAERQHERVKGLALASPDLQGFLPPGELELAQQMLSEGRGQEVVPAQPFAPFYRQSAASIVSRGAVRARLEDTGLAAIRCPVLSFFGDREMGPRAEIAHLFTATTRLDEHLIRGADHVYSGCEDQVAQVLTDWAATLDA